MRYLGLALFAEGPTDQRFLSRVLERLCLDICDQARLEVEVGPMLGLYPVEGSKSAREEQIFQAARAALNAFDILFVHADGANDPERIRNEQVQPGLERVKRELKRSGVAVIPIREMEAWTLADGDALRLAFGSVRSDEMMGLVPPPRVESLTDPKSVLEQAYQKAVDRPRREGHARFLTAIAERVRLERLHTLPSFQELHRELVFTLQALNYRIA